MKYRYKSTISSRCIDCNKVLVVSGVNITEQTSDEDLPNPEKDYKVLLDALHPDIIDVKNVKNIDKAVVIQAKRYFNLSWVIALAALLNAKRYNVVIATGEDVGLRLAFLLKLFNIRVPLIVTCHNISSRRPGFFLKYLRVAKTVSIFQCLSHAQAMMLLGYPGVKENQVQMLYWHVDHNFFAPLPDIPILHQICSAGMASRDYATLLRASEGLGIDIKIAADSPWFQQKLNITTNDMSSHVEVRSYKNYRALRQLYAESRFIVVPLLNVPYSAGYTVILEAMAMGKAVIVSRIEQKDDFIVDGWNGIYVTPGNELELREKIAFLLENPGEALRLGLNARRTVEEQFTLRHYIERMQKHVDLVLESH